MTEVRRMNLRKLTSNPISFCLLTIVFEIYNRQYWFRVIGAVAEDYPGLNALLGEKKFDSLVLAYLKENPSTSIYTSESWIELPKWLEGHPELAPRRHDLLVDVARLEWAYIEAFDSASVYNPWSNPILVS